MTMSHFYRFYVHLALPILIRKEVRYLAYEEYVATLLPVGIPRKGSEIFKFPTLETLRLQIHDYVATECMYTFEGQYYFHFTRMAHYTFQSKNGEQLR